MTKPFTKQEENIMDLLVKAHNEFVKINRTHPMEMSEWVSGIHTLQSLLGNRVLRRHYPETFSNIKDD